MRPAAIIPGILFAASLVSAKSLLVLSISGDAVQAADLAVISQLYRETLEGQFKGTVAAGKGQDCGERECALQAAREAGADEVIYSGLRRLGTKWVFSSTRVGADGANPFSQRLTAISIEDFEGVTRRMADALLNRKTLEQVASVDNLTEKESTREPERRRSLYSTGVALGYLWPTGAGSFKWTETEQTWVCTVYDPTYGYCMDSKDSTVQAQAGYNQIIRLSWVNMWEMRSDLLLNAEVVWGMPDASIGADLNLYYLFGRGDFSPFAGGGLGLHYVHPDDYGFDAATGKRNSGLALNLQGGLMMFRTYDFHVMLRGQYQLILNSDLDNGLGLDAVVSYQKKASARKSESSDGFLSSVAKGIGYTFLVLLAIGMIGAMAGG